MYGTSSAQEAGTRPAYAFSARVGKLPCIYAQHGNMEHGNMDMDMDMDMDMVRVARVRRTLGGHGTRRPL